MPAGYANSDVANYLASGNDTSNIITTANLSGGNVLTSGAISATGNVTGNYFVGNGAQLTSISATGNTQTGNLLTGGTVSATGNIIGGNINTTGVVSATSFAGNGANLGNVLADRGSDQNNWNTLTQMGVYTVNRVSWSGTQGTPLDSQVYVGLLEVLNSTNTSIEQVFYPGTVDTSDAKIQWNRTYWGGSWSDWYKIVNDYQTIPGGEF